jgi:hypothetical protein
MDTYEYTGKNMPLTLEKCINYVTSKLREYDNALANNMKIGKSPYNDKIIMPINDKFVEIPAEAQNEAIKLWLAKKDEISDDSDEEEVVIKKKYKKEKNKDSDYILYIILICLILMTFGFYYLSKLKN